MVDVAESQEDPWAAASAPADPFVAAAPGSPQMAAPPADPIVSPARPTDPDPWATPSAASDPWIETPTSPPADPFGAATSPALPARTEGSPSVAVPPASPPEDPWSQPAAPGVTAAAEAPDAPASSASGARKLRKKLAALTGLHHAGAKVKEKLAKKKSAEPPPAEPAWSAGDEAPTDDAGAGVAIPAAHETSPAAARPASLRLRKAAAKLTGVHGAFSPRAQPDETDEQRAASRAFDAMDVDGDGELSAEEIHAALLKNDADASLERVKELVAKADTDGNGTVSREEYLEALKTDLIPEGWRGTLTGAAQRAREIASNAAAALGPAATKVRKAAAKATGQHGAFSKKNAVPPVDVEDAPSAAPAPSLESMQQNRFRAAASRTMMALTAFSKKETVDATDEPSSPRPHLDHEASGDLRRKQLKKRQGSLAGRLGAEEAKSDPAPRKKKGFANLFGKAQHAFHHSEDTPPQPWTAHGAEAVRTALDAFEADERAMCTANLWIERGDAKRCASVKAALGGDPTQAALGQATPEKASKAIVSAIEGGEPHAAVDAVRALLMMHVPLCKTVHHETRDAFVRAATEPRTAAAQREALQKLVDDLPPIHKQLLGRLAAHLARIVRRQRLNGSSWRGLAAALCPVLLPSSGAVSTTAKIQASIACERLLRVVNAGAGGPKSPRAPESPAWSPRQPAPSPKPHTAFDAFAHMPANPFSPKLASKKKSPKLAMRPPDHHPPGWAPPAADPWPASPPPMLSRAPDSAAPPPPMPSHTPVKDDNGGDPWPAGSADPWPPHASDAPPPMPPHVPDAPPPPMPSHTPEKPPEASDRPPDWKPPPPPKVEGPIEARAVRATYVDEIDSDDSDDDEREWSLRHALEEFGVTKVRVKGKQGVALFGSEKDASDALHAHRVGAWRLSSPSIDASGEQILYTGAGSPQVEDDLERLLATT
ncbi:unnamed protein product [Pelagomonas calceolata]|uniref:EF-hand domain-containing protein n=2 Tax=Pelagomonas calceolata TaxID=35677 RepID=A0A8J2SAD4_9STRA|nr:unnamed protein product [Pelagomonas calceolata]